MPRADSMMGVKYNIVQKIVDTGSLTEIDKIDLGLFGGTRKHVTVDGNKQVAIGRKRGSRCPYSVSVPYFSRSSSFKYLR